MNSRLARIIDWIEEVIGPERNAVVPVSGGSDSALVLWLCAEALPGRVSGVHIGDTLRHREWFEAIGPVRSLPPMIARGEREMLRWAATISHAYELRAQVVGSRNRTEDVLGTYSLPSRIACYLPLAGLWKSEVMELCEIVGVPGPILESSRKADPDCGRPIEMAEIPFHFVDRYLQVRIGERPESDLPPLAAGQISYLESIYQRNQYRRNLPVKGPR